VRWLNYRIHCGSFSLCAQSATDKVGSGGSLHLGGLKLFKVKFWSARMGKGGSEKAAPVVRGEKQGLK